MAWDFGFQGKVFYGATSIQIKDQVSVDVLHQLVLCLCLQCSKNETFRPKAGPIFFPIILGQFLLASWHSDRRSALYIGAKMFRPPIAEESPVLVLGWIFSSTVYIGNCQFQTARFVQNMVSQKFLGQTVNRFLFCYVHLIQDREFKNFLFHKEKVNHVNEC